MASEEKKSVKKETGRKGRRESRIAFLLPIYAFRLKNQKGDPWRFFALPLEGKLNGAMGLLQRHIPEIEMNGNGNYIIRWKDGIKLSELVDYMQFQV